MMKSIKNIAKILAIILISLILLNTIEVQATGITNDMLDNAADQAEKQAIEMFNEKFTTYLGKNVSGTQIKSLISSIKASNEANEEHKVWVNSEGNLPSIGEYKNSEKYNVSVKSYDNKGYISIISIDSSSSSTTTTNPTPEATSTPASGVTISPSPKVTSTPTVVQSKLPQTGIEDYTWLFVAVIVFIGLSIFTYKKIKEYKDIK